MSIQTQTVALRRLARALVEQPADVDDLVQDTWIAALERPPRRDRPLLPWLSQVLRNRRVSLHRASSRAAAREAASPAFTGSTTPDEQVLSRELRDELSRLGAEDREVLLLRFAEGLSAVECAARLGRSASTIRSRHHRALSRLRAALDDRHGGRNAWLGGVALWLERPAAAASTTAVLNATNLTAGGALAAAALWLAAVVPHGCGSTGEVGSDVETAAPRAAVAPRVEPAAASEAGIAALPLPARALPEKPHLPIPQGKRTHYKVAVHKAFRGIGDALAACQTGDGSASVRVTLAIRLPSGQTPVFEGADFERINNLDDGELDCVRQTLLARELDLPPLDESAPDGLLYRPTLDVLFGGNGRARIKGVSRGPATTLITFSKRGEDLLEAVGQCGANPIEVEMDFEPSSGQLDAVRATGAAATQGECVEAAVHASIRMGRRFEPEVEGDETLVCAFENGDYDCRRLGPNGAYLPTPVGG